MGIIFETRTVMHVDGITKVKANGYVNDGVFIGEYRFEGMSYGIKIPLNQIARP